MFNRKLHIVFVCGEYPPTPHGGIGSVVQLLARELVANGVQVTVVGVYLGQASDEYSWDEGVRVVRLATKATRLGALVDARYLWSFVARCSDSNPIDAVEGSELAFWAAPRRTPLRVIRMHGGHRFFADAAGVPTIRSRAWVEKRSFERADALIAVSNYVGARTLDLLGCPERTYEVIPNAVDTELFRPDPEVVRRPGSVLFFGSLCEKKGVRDLLEAWPAVRTARPDASLTVAGRDTMTGPDGSSYVASVMEGVSPETRESLRVIGAVPHDEIPSLLRQSELCVLPSHMEAQGLAWLEAMASGTAVIGTDVGPVRDTIVPGVTGELVEPRNPAEISSRIIQLLDDPARRESLGAQGVQMADEFSARRCAERTADLYERLLGTRERGPEQK